MKCSLHEISHHSFEVPNLSRVFDMTLDDVGNIFLSDEFNHSVIKLSSQGDLIYSIGGGKENPEPFHYPCGLLLHKEHLLVVDSWHHRIVVLDTNGKIVNTIGSYGDQPHQFLTPTHITRATDNRLMLLDFGNERILFLDDDLKTQAQIGINLELDKRHLNSLDYKVFSRNFIGKPGVPSMLTFPRRIAGCAQGLALSTIDYLAILNGDDSESIHAPAGNPFHDLNILHMDHANRYLLLFDYMTSTLYVFDMRQRVHTLLHQWHSPPMALSYEKGRLVVMEKERFVHYEIQVTDTLEEKELSEYASNLTARFFQNSGHNQLTRAATHCLDGISQAWSSLKSFESQHFEGNFQQAVGYHHPPDTPILKKIPKNQPSQWWRIQSFLLDARDGLRRLAPEPEHTKQVISPSLHVLWESIAEYLINKAVPAVHMKLGLVGRLEQNLANKNHTNTRFIDLNIYLFDQFLFTLSSFLQTLASWSLGDQSNWPALPHLPERQQLLKPGFDLYHYLLAFCHQNDQLSSAERCLFSSCDNAEETIDASMALFESFLFSRTMIDYTSHSHTKESFTLETIATSHCLSHRRRFFFENNCHNTFPIPRTIAIHHFNGRYGFASLLRTLFQKFEKQGVKHQNLTVLKAVFHGLILANFDSAKRLLPPGNTIYELYFSALTGDLPTLPENEDPSLIGGYPVACDQAGDFEKALEINAKILITMPMLNPKLFQVRMCILTRRFDEAETILKTTSPDNTQVILHESLLYYGSGKYEEALERLQSMSCDLFFTNYLKGLIYRRKGCHDKAINAFKREHTFFPTWHNHLQIYLTFLNANQPQQVSSILPDEAFILWQQQYFRMTSPQFQETAQALLRAEDPAWSNVQEFGQALRQHLFPLINTRLAPYQTPPGGFQ